MADEVKVETKVPETEVDKKTTVTVETINAEGENKDEAKVETEEEKEQKRLKEETSNKRQNRLNRRFSELTQKVSTHKADAESWRETLREVTGEAPPDRTDFETPEDYQAAVEEYREQIRHPKAMVEQAEKEAGKAEAEYNQVLVDSWNDKIEAAAEELPDYAKIVKAAKVPVHPQTLKAILRNDFGPHIVYHLSQNQEDAYELYDLPVEEQLQEIGRLSLKVQSGRKAVPGKQKTKEPNPLPNGEKPKGETNVSKKDPKDMSLDEFTKWRKSGGGT